AQLLAGNDDRQLGLVPAGEQLSASADRVFGRLSTIDELGLIAALLGFRGRLGVVQRSRRAIGRPVFRGGALFRRLVVGGHFGRRSRLARARRGGGRVFGRSRVRIVNRPADFVFRRRVRRRLRGLAFLGGRRLRRGRGAAQKGREK